jgi:hypothetical protein
MKPRLAEGFNVANGPLFVEKSEDILALYR